MHDLVISHGQLIMPSGPIFADLAIAKGRIAAIGAQLNATRTIDASGCYVIPGGVDCHVHLQMLLNGLTSTDSFVTGTVAAACGGTTTVIDFTDPQPEQSLMESFHDRLAEADGRVAVDYGLHMTIPTWHAGAKERLHDIPAVVAAGCATFKLYQAYDRMQLDDVALLRVMRAVASAGGGVVLHSETGPVLNQLRANAVAAGHRQPIWHERTRPAPLEASAVLRAAEIAALANCPLQHISCRRRRFPGASDRRAHTRRGHHLRNLPSLSPLDRRRASCRSRWPSIHMRSSFAPRRRSGRYLARPDRR